MPTEISRNFPLFISLLSVSILSSYALAQPNPSGRNLRRDNPVDKEDPLRNPLPAAQIGGIVGAYAGSLVLVAIALIALSKKRRDHLHSGNDEIEFAPLTKDIQKPEYPANPIGALGINTQVPPVSNLVSDSYPNQGEIQVPGIYIHPSPVSASTIGCPGLSPLVDQRVVAFDKVMAQNQLEDMYKHVMEHEAAKKQGAVYEAPNYPHPTHQSRPSVSDSMRSYAPPPPRKERFKPASLNLNQADGDKTQSRTSSLFSALRSPRKKAMKGMDISSPMMTPQSATFPRHMDSQEMSNIPPRQYAPPPPPPLPMDQVPYGHHVRATAPVTPPDVSPQSVQSIDERIEKQLPPSKGEHARSHSLAPTEYDPVSATSERSTSALVGLPMSPKPGARFPHLSTTTLPASPKPGATFRRPNAPSAVRTGGALPFRAYDTALATPTHATPQTIKQTVFERRGPLSPSGNMTPYTAGVPYTPYQPFTPVVPMTPSLVTKEDRRRMRRMVPKTPIMEMVQPAEDVW